MFKNLTLLASGFTLGYFTFPILLALTAEHNPKLFEQLVNDLRS